jgi:hypothetical protein
VRLRQSSEEGHRMSHRAQSVDDGSRLGDGRLLRTGNAGMRSKFEEDSNCRRRRLGKGELEGAGV